MSNPDWTRDELVLLLELYQRLNGNGISPANHQVIELSRLLRALPIHPISVRDKAFRNPTGIAMKLRNLQRLDPGSTTAGLQRGGRLEAALWDEFLQDRAILSNTARAIRECYHELLHQQPTAVHKSDMMEYEEGHILIRVHALRERNAAVIQRKKKAVLDETGQLRCEVCGFDFNVQYGALGNGFCECHHIVALAALGRSKITRQADLVVVCANCHRMLHRGVTPISVEALRASVLLRKCALSDSHNARHK